MAATYRIVFTPEARDQLVHLHSYIAAAADHDTASGFVNGILDHIAALHAFPTGARRVTIFELACVRSPGGDV